SGLVKLLDGPIESVRRPNEAEGLPPRDAVFERSSITQWLLDRSSVDQPACSASPAAAHERHERDAALDIGPVSSTVPAERAIGLLRAATELCTQGQILPQHAQSFVRELAARSATFETLTWAVEQLGELADRTAVLRWDDRLGILGVTVATEYSFYWTA